jgi:peptidoglycan hydrolase-like protein with peptidoglycan-binding domain
MEEKTSRILLGLILLIAITSQLLTSGCATKEQAAAPEGSKGPSEVVKPQMPPQASTQPVEKPASQASGASQPASPPETSQAPPPPPTAQQPVLSGETLLDPAVPRNAQMIQSRLAELGLYKGSIDGKWGKMSRAALKSFKEKNGLSNPESWDKDTQILLFRGANLTAQPVSVASQKPISSGLTLLDPAAPLDAQMIQSRLAELGLYRGAIDGKWGKMSRAALRSFKEKNGLSDPESWDKETQILLFHETEK